ncbi:hypothetical protein [Maribacter luteus]|uniref:hypothetical protein n=1 Tax=Maribacter luteus TaxID=2594478 RepID=UPI002492C20C|nr:hypothetical protein [Maribacter luteus]
MKYNRMFFLDGKNLTKITDKESIKKMDKIKGKLKHIKDDILKESNGFFDCSSEYGKVDLNYFSEELKEKIRMALSRGI